MNKIKSNNKIKRFRFLDFEKEAYLSNCIPIYLGSPNINNDFNPETFINAADFNSEDELFLESSL
jgi:hypothetical protein